MCRRQMSYLLPGVLGDQRRDRHDLPDHHVCTLVLTKQRMSHSPQVFSKIDSGRMPTLDEIVGPMQQMLSVYA